MISYIPIKFNNDIELFFSNDINATNQNSHYS